MKTIVLGVLLLLGGMVYGQNKEVLLMEEYGIPLGYNKGMYTYIVRPNGETEEIKLKIPLTKEEIIENFKTRAATLQKLYKEGWHLVSTVGENSVCRYIFERERP